MGLFPLIAYLKYQLLLLNDLAYQSLDKLPKTTSLKQSIMNLADD